MMNKLTQACLRELGYGKMEAIWIYNMYNNHGVRKDGHTGATHMYTKTIVSNLKKFGLEDWSKYHAHITYGHMFKHFYFRGLPLFGNHFISYHFNDPKEFQILEKFRSQYRLNGDDHKIYIPVLTLIDKTFNETISLK